MTWNKSNCKAFTLVELLVSVAIVGILASVSVSIFDEYKIKAKHAVRKTLLHNMRTAYEARAESYIAENTSFSIATSTTTGQWSNATIAAAVLPGIGVLDMPNPSHWQLSAGGRNCATTTLGSWCTWVGVAHCSDGIREQYRTLARTGSGYMVYQAWYWSAMDDVC